MVCKECYGVDYHLPGCPDAPDVINTIDEDRYLDWLDELREDEKIISNTHRRL